MRTISSRFHSHRPSLATPKISLNIPIHCFFCSTATGATAVQHQPTPPSPPPPLINSNSQKEAEKILIELVKSCNRKTHFPQIHTHLIRTSHLLNPTIFLHFLSRIALPPFQDLTYSHKIFQHYPKPNISLYNVMIRAHSLSDYSPPLGFELFKKMISLGFSPDAFSSLSAVKCCIRTGSLLNGSQVHSRILRDGNNSDTFLLSTLMDFYSVNERCDEACKLFDEMSYRDTGAWNVLISCYIRNKRTRDALTVFDIMEKSEGRRPDEVSCLFVLEACANLTALDFGERVHNYAKNCGLIGSLKVCNSLIAMYSRCGCVQKAYDVFKSMANKDLITWSAMISGLASNGYARDAIEAFREMQRVGIAPDAQTFTGLLSGCSHSGLVDEGRMFFDCMTKEFGFVPNIYHYSCMVDLMGRAGLLDEAYELIRTMKVKPDEAIWRTLLGACRIHNHTFLGERIVEHIIELKAKEAGDYVLLLNTHSSVGDWEKVMEVRKLMREKGIQMAPACSTIEVNDKIHEFVADDFSHPRKREIYEMLDEINNQLKIAGYVAEKTAELHNTDVQNEQTTLSYHSEKLAIAFGVLATPPGTRIRVAKDLQICVDCHNFAKILSAVYNREVIIRDHNRFHHFREGRCSCNDYR